MCFVSWYSSGTENATKPNAIASSACFSPIATEGEVRHARRGSPRARACRVTRVGVGSFGVQGRNDLPNAQATYQQQNTTSLLPTLLPMTSCA